MQAAERQLQRKTITDTAEHFAAETIGAAQETMRFDPAYAVRLISDLVPNPFVGREIVGGLLGELTARGIDDAKLGALSSQIIDELRRALDTARNEMAEKVFKDSFAAGKVQFRLRLDGKNWRLPFAIETNEPEGAWQVLNKSGGA